MLSVSDTKPLAEISVLSLPVLSVKYLSMPGVLIPSNPILKALTFSIVSTIFFYMRYSIADAISGKAKNMHTKSVVPYFSPRRTPNFAVNRNVII